MPLLKRTFCTVQKVTKREGCHNGLNPLSLPLKQDLYNSTLPHILHINNSNNTQPIRMFLLFNTIEWNEKWLLLQLWLLYSKTESKQQIVLQITVYLILRVWLPVFQSAVHIQRATTISTALLTPLLPCYSRGAQQWQEQLDDEELCLLLGVFCCLIVVITLQWQCETALNVLLYRITFN